MFWNKKKDEEEKINLVDMPPPPRVMAGDWNRMTVEQRAIIKQKLRDQRNPRTNFPATEDPKWVINTWPEFSRPQQHALGTRFFIDEKDKQAQEIIDKRLTENYGNPNKLETWDVFPISRSDFNAMKSDLEAAEKDKELLFNINVLPSLYLDEEWLTKAELFKPSKWEQLKELMGIETPIETIDVLEKERQELREWKEKKGLFDLPSNYRTLLRLDAEDVWSKEKEEQAIASIRASFPSLSEHELNHVRDEARRRASAVAQVWSPLIFGSDSSKEEEAINYNLQDLSWVPQPRGISDEKRKEMDWYMDNEIRRILQGIGHFSEEELGPAPQPPESIRDRFHLTPEQYLYYKSYFEPDPVTDYIPGALPPPEFFPKLKTEDEKDHDPYSLQDVDLTRYHEPEYKKALADRMEQFVNENKERRDTIATFRQYGMTLRKDENEVYLKRMQQDPFYDEDLRDRPSIDIRFQKAPWRDEIEDYDEDLVDVPGFMLPKDPLRDGLKFELTEENAPFDTDIIPLEMQRKIQADYLDDDDMQWPATNYYNESVIDTQQLADTDVQTLHQLIHDVYPSLEENRPPHFPDDEPPYNPNDSERRLLETAEHLFNHFAYLKRAAHIADMRLHAAEYPSLAQKIGSEPMPKLKRKHPVIDHLDLITSAANKIMWNQQVMEHDWLEYSPSIELGQKAAERAKLKYREEALNTYIDNDPLIQQAKSIQPPEIKVSYQDRPPNEAYSIPVKPISEKQVQDRIDALKQKVDKELKEKDDEVDEIIYGYTTHRDLRRPPHPDPEWFAAPKAELSLDDLGLVPLKESIEQTITSIESHHSIPRAINYVKFVSSKLGMDEWSLEQLYAATEISTVVLLTPLKMMRIQSFVSPSAKLRFQSALRWIPFSPSVTSVFILKKLIKWGLRAMGLQTVVYFPIACIASNLLDNLSTNVIIRNTDPITAAVEMYQDYGWRAIIRGLPWKILSSTADVVLDYFTEGHLIFHWLDNKSYNVVSRLWPWGNAVLERIQNLTYDLAKRAVLAPFAWLRYRSYVSDPHRKPRKMVWPSVLSVIGLIPVSLIEYTIRFFIKSTVIPYIALSNPPKVLKYSQNWAPGTGPVRIHTPLYPAWESQLFSSNYWEM